MKNLLFRAIVLFVGLGFVFNADSAMGQFKPGSQSSESSQSKFNGQKQSPTSETTSGGVQNGAISGTRRGLPQPPVIEPQRPWKLSSRIHLEKGTNKGYLVVQLDLDEGYSVYSLNPAGSPSPTRLAVLPSNDLRVVSKFASDKAPIVIEKDPVFEQRIEKHKGQVQFFASIEVRPGVDLQKLAQDVQFSGQVCSESACQPIREQTASAKFSGYFEIPKTRNATNGQKLK